MKKLIEYRCKNCGKQLHIDVFNQKEITCEYCGSIFQIEDDEMQSFGYQFEMGRLKAQEDYKKHLEEELSEYMGLSV